MKKILALLLAVCLAATALSACVIIDDEKPLTTNAPDGTSSTDTSTAPPETKAPETAEVTIAETVVYDENGIKITVTGIDNNSLFGKEIKFLVENSTDKNITVSGNTFIVNGVTLYGMMYIDVAAGKKANDTLTFMRTDLENAGISEIASVSAHDLHITDTDSFDTLYEIPLSIETSVSETYSQAINDAGDVVFEQDGITVIAQVVTDSMWGNTVRLLVKNGTGKDVIVNAENISVNGFTITAWMYDVVCKDTVRFCDLDLFSSGLKDNGIEEIEDVSFTIRVTEEETYDPITESGELQVFVTK